MKQPDVQADAAPAPQGGQRLYDAATAPIPTFAKRATCPVCGTVFAPKETLGKCPVCGEQVIRSSLAMSDIPVISPVWQWLRHGGNWRLAAVGALVLYQIVLFIVLCVHLAQTHAF